MWLAWVTAGWAAEGVSRAPFPAADASTAECERALHARRADAAPDEQRALDRVYAGWLAAAARPAVDPASIPRTPDGRIDWSRPAAEREWYLGEVPGCAADLATVAATPESTRTRATFRLAAPASGDARLLLEVDGRERWVLSGEALRRGVTLDWPGHPAFTWTVEGLPAAPRVTGPAEFATEPVAVDAWSFTLEVVERAETTPEERAWNDEIPVVTPFLGDCHWRPRPLDAPVQDRALTVVRDGATTVLRAEPPASMVARLDAGTWDACDAPAVLARWRAR